MSAGRGSPVPAPAQAGLLLRPASPAGVLSEEQIRKKKIQKQQQQQQQPPPQQPLPVEPGSSSSSTSGPGTSPGGSEAGSQGPGEGEGIQLTAAQELMIQQLVAAQLQCNKRSFSDQPKVTVLCPSLPSCDTGWGMALGCRGQKAP